MKVSLEGVDDVSLINWEKVNEQIQESFRRNLVKALDRAIVELSELQPGETRTIPVEMPSITISRGEDEESEASITASHEEA